MLQSACFIMGSVERGTGGRKERGMIKAVFLDYSGTAVSLEGKEMSEMIRIILGSVRAPQDPAALVKEWFSLLGKLEWECRGETYADEDELVYRVLEQLDRKYGLDADFRALHDLNQRIWRTADLFEDARALFAGGKVPVYVLTNNTASYVLSNLQAQGVRPAGVISADEVRSYKPHPEIFQRALEVSGCRKEEVVHAGDSLEGDVLGAGAAGIFPVLVDRKGKYPEGKAVYRTEEKEIPYRVIRSLERLGEMAEGDL